ncbi:hypothetical protein PLICRDRAFT_35588 [Plicaturopsis crispa FD-325 SS-3]|nr:hypothetical protein PLICRDRAFT_35588 [Plicaturopsis crispa FD-325 SS-3]
MDAPQATIDGEDVSVDPETSIAFPKTLRIASKFPLPEFTLVGLGVRKVSILGIKVYSIGFYADLSNPNLDIPITATPDEKIEYIVRNTACVIRIVPTRSTSYTHLRDAFIRSLHARVRLATQNHTITDEETLAVQSPLRQFKSMFPTAPLAKHAPLEVLLTAPNPARPRALVIRDMGTVENTWVAEEFMLSYFEGEGPSPPLKKSVVGRLEGSGGHLV